MVLLTSEKQLRKPGEGSLILLPKYHPSRVCWHHASARLDESQVGITSPTKVHTVKVMFFPVVMYRCESWTIKKVEHEKVMLLSCGAGEDS